jgi:uncharacterized MAPEG superfamily protein
MTLFLVSVAYAVALPFAVMRYARLRKAELAAAEPVTPPAEPPAATG